MIHTYRAIYKGEEVATALVKPGENHGHAWVLVKHLGFTTA